VVVAAVAVVGRVGIAEQAGEPEAQVARVDRHDDVAVVSDHVLQRGEWVAALTQHRVVDQPLLAAEITAIEGNADVVAGRRLPVGGPAPHEQVRARTIGSRHACLLRSVGLNCWAGIDAAGELCDLGNRVVHGCSGVHLPRRASGASAVPNGSRRGTMAAQLSPSEGHAGFPGGCRLAAGHRRLAIRRRPGLASGRPSAWRRGAVRADRNVADEQAAGGSRSLYDR
jgi:hypothetical protein